MIQYSERNEIDLLNHVIAYIHNTTLLYLFLNKSNQVFRLSHVVLAIIGISTFWYLQKLLHLKVQKSYEKAKLKTKLKVKKVLYCDSHKTTGSIRIKLWKLFKECQFFPQENGCFAQNNYFLWKEYVMGHKSFLKW